MVRVASCNAATVGLAVAKMTSGPSATNSAAYLRYRSASPDGQRLSMRGSDKAQDKNQDRIQEKNPDKTQDAVPQAEAAMVKRDGIQLFVFILRGSEFLIALSSIKPATVAPGHARRPRRDAHAAGNPGSVTLAMKAGYARLRGTAGVWLKHRAG